MGYFTAGKSAQSAQVNWAFVQVEVSPAGIGANWTLVGIEEHCDSSPPAVLNIEHKAWSPFIPFLSPHLDQGTMLLYWYCIDT